MKRQKSPLENVLTNLGSLDKAELRHVFGIVKELLNIESPETLEELMKGVSDQVAIKKGYIEEKLINGYGPYKYLRLWVSGHLTSTYLGKANKD